MVMVRLKGSESFAKSSFDLRRLIYFLVGDCLKIFFWRKGRWSNSRIGSSLHYPFSCCHQCKIRTFELPG